MTSQKGLRACFSVVTVNAAKVMHLEGYGLKVGGDASFVLQARDAVEATWRPAFGGQSLWRF